MWNSNISFRLNNIAKRRIRLDDGDKSELNVCCEIITWDNPRMSTPFFPTPKALVLNCFLHRWGHRVCHFVLKLSIVFKGPQGERGREERNGTCAFPPPLVHALPLALHTPDSPSPFSFLRPVTVLDTQTSGLKTSNWKWCPMVWNRSKNPKECLLPRKGGGT